ncbi:hypothetical protein L3V82_12615 [Thiotrichales bacterium 19S3-7]|nr:hypothetical protein [Thiotrichales bacterium 19S3-7]MCF6802787.1 hypothetical protein [Thiotrichales bacterium 19S3-11]
MHHFDSFDCYFNEYGSGKAIVNKAFELDCVHRRDTKSFQLDHYDFNANSGLLEFKYSDRGQLKIGDLIEINELKFNVETIIDQDNGIMLALLSDYKVSDGYIDFDIGD